MNIEERLRTHRTLNQEGVEPRSTPDAIEAATLRRSRAGIAGDFAAARARGVEWVRPTDLIARGGSRVARAGIDFHKELHRLTRAAAADGAHAIAEQARRLPPLSAFGHHSITQNRERGAIGMR